MVRHSTISYGFIILHDYARRRGCGWGVGRGVRGNSGWGGSARAEATALYRYLKRSATSPPTFGLWPFVCYLTPSGHNGSYDPRICTVPHVRVT